MASFIEGKYKIDYKLQSFKDRICASIGIFKGDVHIGLLFYHTKAKQIVYDSFNYLQTADTMMFVTPLMDLKYFILICKEVKSGRLKCKKE